MNRFAALAVLGMTSVCQAENCSERVEKILEPMLPRSMAVGTLITEGPCSVDLEFMLLPNGKPDAVEYSAEETRCRVFFRSAIQALHKSKFRKGDKALECKHTYDFSLDE